MTIKVFDTHVRTKSGRYLHFDVLIEGNDLDKANTYAREYLMSKGINDDDITQSECRFCHVEPSHPMISHEIAQKGYFILELEGCQES